MGNCLEGCMSFFKKLTTKKLMCPKCNRHRWNKRKSRKKFLSEGCIICTMYEKYKFKPININDTQKYKPTGRYYNHSDEVTIENVQIFAVDDRQNKKIRNNDNYLPFI
jgi:hypothetical protein